MTYDQARLTRAILAPLSLSDCPGEIYAYWDRCRHLWKYGRSNNSRRRVGQWARQCGISRTDWHPIVWAVPFATKFDRTLHLYLKDMGLWAGRVKCAHHSCHRHHIEMFNIPKADGPILLERLVRKCVRRLGYQASSRRLWLGS
ncbi:hypothetical protein B0H17DRAFT_1039890 [Mycena rosella]|uniref:Bacteriophage T5 Orf172 DNA-binding domain-containing protein n=1 Tax=Mycena rosella TaxID=1033263 RepID=A0AAD7M7E1_MYCRO|nr:hypothetical protein B0H17DRAFT_1039890 [Mycena rosella]